MDNSTYELKLHKDIDAVVFKYNENYFPEIDTEPSVYDHYKFNIMLTSGLAAVLNRDNDIYNTFCGDLLFFSPAELHHGRVLRQGIHRYIEILIPTNAFEQFFPNLDIKLEIFNENCANRTNFISPRAEDREKILSLAERVRQELSGRANDIHLFMLLIEILELAEGIYKKREKLTVSENIPPILKKSISIIKSGFAENITVEDIAKELKCSTSYISRIFRKHTGETPYGYLTEYRLFQAERLLRSGASVTEAALGSGFCNSSVFIKNFKKSFGVTPHKYKTNRESVDQNNSFSR